MRNVIRAIIYGAAALAISSPAAFASTDSQRLDTEGHKFVNAAWDYEAQAIRNSGYSANGRLRFHELSVDSYQKALDRFVEAANSDATDYAARSMAGFVLRKLGHHDAAIAQYDAALAINPQDARTMEYRAEALMEVGRYDEVKTAYFELAKRNTELASDLLAFMKIWMERPDPSQQAMLQQTAQRDLHEWVNGRMEIVSQLSRL